MQDTSTRPSLAAAMLALCTCALAQPQPATDSTRKAMTTTQRPAKK